MGLHEFGLRNVGWTYMAPDRDTCRAAVNEAVIAQVSYRVGKSLII